MKKLEIKSIKVEIEKLKTQKVRGQTDGVLCARDWRPTALKSDNADDQLLHIWPKIFQAIVKFHSQTLEAASEYVESEEINSQELFSGTDEAFNCSFLHFQNMI